MTLDMQYKIDGEMKEGERELKAGNNDAALEAFKRAHVAAKKQDNHTIIRRTMFNLGAVHIAIFSFKEGIEILKSVITYGNTSENNPSQSDIYYNLALGYELIDNRPDAIRCLEMSKTRQQDNTMDTMVACKLGRLYALQEDYRNAAEAYGNAALGYKMTVEKDQEAICRCHQAMMLEKDGRIEEAAALASQCITLFKECDDSNLSGNLYNELGLLFVKCQKISQAEVCFQLAILVVGKIDQKSAAVIQQNIGAIYNCLGDYKTSLKYHESAAKLHAKTGCRNGQGQCFSNLAFAYAQLGFIDSAAEFYLHALQASKDTIDMCGQYQALDGLATAAFHDKRFDRAEDYFKKALIALKASDEEEATKAAAQGRLATKLKEVIELQSNMKPDVNKTTGLQQHSLDLQCQKPLNEVTAKDQLITSKEKTTKDKDITTLEDQQQSVVKSTTLENQQPMLEKAIPSKVQQSVKRTINSEKIGQPDTVDNATSPMGQQSEDKSKQVKIDKDLEKTTFKDNILVSSYQKQLERKEDESTSGSDDCDDDDDDDDDSNTGSDTAILISSAPMKTAPRVAQSSSKSLYGTYESPLDLQTSVAGTSGKNTTIKVSEPSKDDPTYTTICVKDGTNATIPPPPPLRQPSHPHYTPYNMTDNETDIKLPKKQSDEKHTSRACHIM